MKYYKCWKEHPEELKKQGESIGWFETSLKDVVEHISYASTKDIIVELEMGCILQSSFAYYIGIRDRIIHQGG